MIQKLKKLKANMLVMPNLTQLAQANVITKINFDAKINEVENNIKKLQTFESSYFMGKNYFDADGTQNYLVLCQYLNILN